MKNTVLVFVFCLASFVLSAKTVNFYAPKDGGTNGLVLVAAGDRQKPYWANVTGDTMYQHNIYCCDTNTNYHIAFSFINSVSAPYTTGNAISLALYNLGHKDKYTSVVANGYTGKALGSVGGYVNVYGFNDSLSFRFFKTIQNAYYFEEWDQYYDTVTIVSHSTLAVNSGVNSSGLSFNDIYPIGSVYISVGETLPPIFTAEGRTWVKISNNTFLMSADGTTTGIGSYGGSNNKTLTINNLPAHTHTVSGTTASSGSHSHERKGWWSFVRDTSSSYQGASKDYISTDSPSYATEAAGAHTHTFSTTSDSNGSGNAFDNRPYYLAVSMWKRTN